MRIFKSNEKNFLRSNKEVSLRCLWFALKVHDSIAAIFLPGAPSHWIDDERFFERDRKEFIELIAYTMSFAFTKLHDEIQRAHGRTDKAVTLDKKCREVLARAFNLQLGSKKGDEYDLSELFRQYHAPPYDEDYEKYWGISNREPVSKQLYNVDKYHTHRISRIFGRESIPERQKFIEKRRKLYSNIALSFYDEAFFEASLRKIKAQVRRILNIFFSGVLKNYVSLINSWNRE